MSDQSSDSITLFDSKNLESRLMGDGELVSQVLEACVPDINANFRDFALAIEAGEIGLATLRIHAMKGASQNADLSAVSNLTFRIEKSLRGGDSKFALDSVDLLANMVSQTIGEIRSYLDN
ncbi:Hpt domain-containing protein [Pelagicoccus sp. SDUM812002]|uniref:Hpt domain-containing protein n=1 Tax=Pelagicoccus sp. SDUM812002 TaxID=3041266 RepID=UPI00281074C0|nr:Hpt domain-containing protein [Pelagicoccus sp. SDUM812002]MDQ8187959.1 Hpt domain-containing protein [Pelagicoccus sp. SDUM812002]